MKIILITAVLLGGLGSPAGADDRNLLVPDLAEFVAQIADYQVRVVSWARDNENIERRIIDMYHKRDGKLRIDVVEGSRFGDTGSIAIVDGDTITARPGLKFVPFALKYDRDNPRVQTVRGRAIDNAHLNVVLEQMLMDLASENATVFIANDYYVFENVIERDYSRIVERMYFDVASLLPRHYETFDNRTLVEYVDWLHYHFDLGLPDSIFNASYRKRALMKLEQTPLASIEPGSIERDALEPGPPWSVP